MTRRPLPLILLAILAVPFAAHAEHDSFYFNYTGAGTVFGAPGDAAVFILDVRNGGDAPVVIDFEVATLPPGWSAMLEHGSLAVPPGTRILFELTVTPDKHPLLGRVIVEARLDGGEHVRRAAVTVYQHLKAVVDLDSSEVLVHDAVEGVVRFEYANGVGADAIAFGFEERWLGLEPARARAGVTDASGAWSFRLDPDPAGSHLPGRHELRVAATVDGRVLTAQSGYAVGAGL